VAGPLGGAPPLRSATADIGAGSRWNTLPWCHRVPVKHQVTPKLEQNPNHDNWPVDLAGRYSNQALDAILRLYQRR
jgi:hypothetical protein